MIPKEQTPSNNVFLKGWWMNWNHLGQPRQTILNEQHLGQLEVFTEGVTAFPIIFFGGTYCSWRRYSVFNPDVLHLALAEDILRLDECW